MHGNVSRWEIFKIVMPTIMSLINHYYYFLEEDLLKGKLH